MIKQIIKHFRLPAMMLFLFCAVTATLTAQTRTVTGIITDSETGETLPGATVQVKGTTNGIATDADGKYSLSVSGNNAVLIVTYIGYEKKEVAAGSKNVLDVALKEILAEIDEVVVIGYGAQKKASLTGSVVAITSKEIVTTKSIDVSNSLTGKMAGVKVVQGSSEPGDFDSNSFSIRGMGTPLFIIDGVPRDNITRIDQNEVESISVLKDASAAVYGAKAANGVVLVTTKQGARDSKFRFDYTGYMGVDRFINDVNALNAQDFMHLKNEQRLNSGQKIILYPLDAFIPYMTGERQSSDWVNEFVNHYPLRTQHSINASGGSKNINYFTNFGYSDQQGRWKTNSASYRRFNLRSNVTADLAKGLQARVQINLMRDNRDEQPESSWRIFNASWDLYPTDPIYLPDPATGAASTAYPYNVPTNHPGIMTNTDIAGYNRYSQSLVQTNMQLEWEIPHVKDLKLHAMYSYDYTVDDTKMFRKTYPLYNRDYTTLLQGTPYIRTDYRKRDNTLLQLDVSYKAKLFKKNNIDLKVIYEESERQSNNFYVKRDVLIGSIEEVYAGSQTQVLGDQNLNNVFHYTNRALIGTLNYDFDEKYLLTFNFRYDGSSKYAPMYQWGFFPGVSAGWRLSEEKFIKENPRLSFINNLKLRGSYGVMGDDGAMAYQFLSGYEYPFVRSYQQGGGYIVDGKYINSVNPTSIPNTEITWSTSTTVNLGIDIDLWKGLFGMTAEIFRRDREGLLARSVTVIMPNEAGIELPQENINSDRTEGAELTLTHRNKISDFRYNISTYISLDRTRITYFQRIPSTTTAGNWRNNQNDRWGRFDGDNAVHDFYWGVNSTGQFSSFDEIFASGVIYDAKGNTRLLPGDPIYIDYNKDGVIDGQDEHPIAILHPAFSYGFTLGGDWRGFDIGLTFQGTGMNKRRLADDATRLHFEQPLRGDVSGLDVFIDRWHRTDPYTTDDGPRDGSTWISGKYPSAYTNNDRNHVLIASDYWLDDSKYLRLKTLELGYTIPSKLTRKVSIEKARFFFNGYNLITVTPSKLMDPEQSGQYPLNRSFSFGANLTF
jgi:TonB-linked SusC/RagA family outer membrane protein